MAIDRCDLEQGLPWRWVTTLSGRERRPGLGTAETGLCQDGFKSDVGHLLGCVTGASELPILGPRDCQMRVTRPQSHSGL